MQDKIVNHDVNLQKWNITKLYKDTLWVQMIDEPDADYVHKNGLYLRPSAARPVFRLGKVLLAGPTSTAKVDDYVLIPPGFGIFGLKNVGGYKTCFIAEEKVMAVVEFDGTTEEFTDHVETELKGS